MAAEDGALAEARVVERERALGERGVHPEVRVIPPLGGAVLAGARQLDAPAETDGPDAGVGRRLRGDDARERADVGLAVCLGDREDALDRARTLLRNHRRNLSEGLQWVQNEGTTIEDNLQWFDAGSRIRETIVGIVAGMAVGASGIRGDIPILAFAEKSADEVKVSARGSHVLVRDGLDLSAVMREASRAVGGDGGGHDVAAGATIPSGTREAFVAEADRIVGEQLD